MDLEHQRAYVYAPPIADERPVKRQRTAKSNPSPQLQERLETFQSVWDQQRNCIQAKLEEAEAATQERLINFISASLKHDGHSEPVAIPAALIIAGPSIASHGPYFARLGQRLKISTNSSYIILTSSECVNLKMLLKNLIKKATLRVDEDEDDEGVIAVSTSSRNGPKVLDFDLAHLYEWQKRNRATNIVIVIQDSEAFDTSVLIELVDILHSWLDRLPFVLLFGIATSAESFEDRLSARSLRSLDGLKFEVTQSDEVIEELFNTTLIDRELGLCLGPNLCRRILDRQKDHVQNIQDFSDSLKYAYMSHFYANYPSIFLKDGITQKDIPPEAFEAVRNLPSFRRWVEQLLETEQSQRVRDVLESDEILFEEVASYIKSGHERMVAISNAVQVLASIRISSQMSPFVLRSSLWIRAAAGEMAGSPLLRETMLSIKKMPSDKLGRLLASLASLLGHQLPFDLGVYEASLAELVKDDADAIPLRTQHDVRSDSLRTTVVAQKVLLSKHKATLSERDKAYSDLVTQFHDELEAFFELAFVDPRELFLSEILMYDLKSPHTEVFQPRPRFAIERALASPHDYLGCTCCGMEAEAGEVTLSASQPATAILYQMYLESGSIINVSDLWSAFNAINGDDEEHETRTRALFQRALAELKYLGFVKSSRKKTDHVAKMMWKGL